MRLLSTCLVKNVIWCKINLNWISSPLATQEPVSSASPSSTHSHRGWGRTVGLCMSTCSQIRSWQFPLCRSPPHVRCRSAAAGRRPYLEGAWCTYSGSLSPLMSSEQALSRQRSGRDSAEKGILCCLLDAWRGNISLLWHNSKQETSYPSSILSVGYQIPGLHCIFIQPHRCGSFWMCMLSCAAPSHLFH